MKNISISSLDEHENATSTQQENNSNVYPAYFHYVGGVDPSQIVTVSESSGDDPADDLESIRGKLSWLLNDLRDIKNAVGNTDAEWTPEKADAVWRSADRIQRVIESAIGQA